MSENEPEMAPGHCAQMDDRPFEQKHQEDVPDDETPEQQEKRLMAYYQPPFKAEFGFIKDSSGRPTSDMGGAEGLAVNEIARVRGYGFLSYKKGTQSLLRTMGKIIAEALTEYWQKDINTGVRRRLVVASACRQKYTHVWHHQDDEEVCEPEERYVTFVGVRHFDMLMNSQIRNCRLNLNKGEYEQGFVDQYGVFMTRAEAYVVARDAGQLNYRRPYTSSGTELHSEDVW